MQKTRSPAGALLCKNNGHCRRALEKASWVPEHVCAEAPHRQFVFTIPKRLRIHSRFDRRLLGEVIYKTPGAGPKKRADK